MTDGSDRGSGPLNVAIVGAGKAGTNLAMAFSACADARVVRVMSRTEASARCLAGRIGGVEWSTQFGDVVSDEDVHAVVIATPDKLHAEQAVAAAAAGKHVLCEKPMCRGVVEAETMIRTAREHGVVLMVGFCERFNQPCLDAKRRIEAGEIGDPVMILARRCHPRSLVRGRDWLNDADTGGVLNYAGTHNIDLICWFMDSRPVRVYAEMGKLVLKDRDFTDCAVMTFRFENGGIATLYESFAYPDPYPHGVDRSIEVLGTKGCLSIDFMSQPLTVHGTGGAQVGDAVTWPVVDGRMGGALGQEARHFTEAVLKGTPVMTPGETGLTAIRVAEAARKAFETGAARGLDDG